MQVDFYYLGLDRAEAAFNRGTADEHRHTLGARLFGTPGALDYNFEGMYQWGSFGHGDIRAWALGSDTGYTFKSAPLAPRIALRAEVMSDDRHPEDDELGTFNPLRPRGNYFGESTTPRADERHRPASDAAVAVGGDACVDHRWRFFWRQSREDRIYSNALDQFRLATAAAAATSATRFPCASIGRPAGASVCLQLRPLLRRVFL